MANTVLVADAIAYFAAYQAQSTEQAKEVGQILTEITYHNKLRDKRMEWRDEWEKNGWYISTFYAWCHHHGLPS